ncbi:MAG: SDR family NAD(P)-dependent oxidoreductase [Planctomycetes bacterium]|nr:SDR family NAD(P)-dependent oxidoreductase [Planctomycetota bacterium]
MSKRAKGAGPQATPIAIIGMGCMFPKARDLKEYWRLLRTGGDGITDTPATHWGIGDYFDADPKTPDMTYCHRGGFIPPVPFDPTEFGIPPTILEATDTSQLLGLVIAKRALEDAGYGESREFNRERVGVILGITGLQELALPLGARLGHPVWRKALAEAGVDPDVAEDVVVRIADGYVGWQENSFPGLLGNVVAGRIANRLNLRGTNCVVDAACASSLSAVHLAMLELATGRSDMAIAGGVDTLNDIFMYMCFSKTPALSPTGDARPFADSADGTVLGEGIGMLVLKRLPDAQRDGDRIYAVIRSMGTSSDGRSQSIYAPHAGGQARALRNAYELADVDPDSITLIEAHGTGTKVGDAVEFDALRTVFREAAPDGTWCALGSVKSQIGHTKAAAGAAGLIKTALALYHRALPPTIKVDAPNAKMAIEDSPFFLNTRMRPWLTVGESPRRAGVSSFGFGGSNFHAVLEEHEATLPEPAWDGSVEIIALSADTIDGLQANLSEWQKRVADEWFDHRSLAWHAAESRRAFDASRPHRLLLVVEEAAALSQQLEQASSRLLSNAGQASWSVTNTYYGSGPAEGLVAFLFPGQGSQHVDMARELACTFPEMQAALARADAAAETADTRINTAVYPTPTFDEALRERQAQALTRTDIAQPALGAIALGMADVLRRFGVKPDLAAGHSYGELVALFAAGVFDESSLHHLSRLRGRLMAAGDGDRGTMLAVKAPLGEIERLIADGSLDVILANRNSPTQGVLSGDRAEIARAVDLCKQRGIAATQLNVSGAFHSRLMESAVAPFRQALESVEFLAPRIPVVATSTAKPYPSDAASARALLGRQLLEPVDFVGQIETLYHSGARTFIEVGPKSVLTGLADAILDRRGTRCIAVDASAGKRSGVADLARCLCRLAAEGRAVELEKWEKPSVQPRKPRMIVPLVGANYRAPRAALEPATATLTQSRDPAQQSRDRKGAGSVNSEIRKGREHDVIAPAPMELRTTDTLSVPTEKPTAAEFQSKNVNSPPMSQPKPPPSPAPQPTPALVEAMRIVQEGLQAMQALQQQTAAAHQRFLESQEQAHRSIQLLIENQHRLLSGGMAQPMSIAAPMIAQPAPIPQPLPSPAPSVIVQKASAPVMAPPAPIAPPVVPVAPPPSKAESPRPSISPSASAPPATSDINNAAVVLDVVCEKTGYPRDMIDLSMDIEADLGIDSIKRVEIVAAVEERIPGFTGIKPEYMGSIRTLAEIVTFIDSGATDPSRDRKGAGSQIAEVKLVPEPELPDTNDPHRAGNLSTAAFSDTLLDVVAQLTGYPREMLELGMDMEADLGIDSIKRVEILAGVEARIPEMPTVQPDYMGSLRTLQQIVDYCTSRSTKSDALIVTPTPSPARIVDAPRPQPRIAARPVERRVLSLIDLPALHAAPLSLAPGSSIGITDDGTDLSKTLAARLSAMGFAASLIDIRNPPSAFPHCAGLIIVAPRRAGSDALWSLQAEQFLKSAFAIAKSAAKSLQSSVATGGALFATITRMDGAFGLFGRDHEPAHGGLAGLAKTAAHEWPGVTCKAIDVDAAWLDIDAITDSLLREFAAPGPLEVALGLDSRRGLRLDALSTRTAPLDITDRDVILITGGARGVTAETAVALARAARPRLILLGRSPAPTPEPSWLAPLESESDIKQAILTNEFAGREKPKAADLQAAYIRYMANREVQRNLARMTDAGAQVLYRSVDVRDIVAIKRVVTEVSAALGPVTGLIHAAGVLEDRLIADKTPEQFDRVFDTKIVALRNLLAAVNPGELRNVIFFSSVSARFGNRGQSDYAVANESLNKIAHRLSISLPDCRVRSLNWGPWDGGMVGPSLKREFVRQGIDLIPLESGAAALVEELANTGEGIEVILGAGFPEPTIAPPAPAPTAATMHFAFERRLDLASHTFLRSHVLGGRPVLPLAMSMEWMAHAAMHAHPGLRLQGLDAVRVLRGVAVDAADTTLAFHVGDPRRKDSQFFVNVEMRGHDDQAREVVYASATVILGSRPAPAPAIPYSDAVALQKYPRDLRAAYSEILFHGKDLRGIQKVDGWSSGGIVALVGTAPAPAQWMANPLRSDWLTDPLVIDSAFQLAILWCFEELGMVSLPSALGSYRQFRTSFPRDGVTAVLEVTDHTQKKMTCDVTFFDLDAAVVARIEGYECTADPSLRAAFRKAAASI